MHVLQIANYLKRQGCELKGCSPEEISKIETIFDVQLPISYKQFLSVMGKGAGAFMKGSSVFYDEIFDLREGSIELLEENNFKSLPIDTFVFYMHQGYQFAFFYLRNGDNPPIFYYSEGTQVRNFELKERSFTDFLMAQLAVSGLK
jgi:hypothetical protein